MDGKEKGRFEDLFQEWVGETERNNAVLPDDEKLKKKLDSIVEKLLKKAVGYAK